MLFYSEYVFIKRKKMEKENASTDAFVFYQTEDIAVQEWDSICFSDVKVKGEAHII